MIARTTPEPSGDDEALDSEGLGRVVRQAVIDAISGKEFDDPVATSDDLAIVGPNVTATVRAAAAKAAMELVGRSAILAAPLADLERRLRATLAEAKTASAEAGRLRDSLDAGTSSLEPATGMHVPGEPPAAVASAPVVAPAAEAPVVVPAAEAPVAPTAPDEPEPAPVKPKAPAKPKAPRSVPPGVVDPDEPTLLACGEPVKFSEKATAEFRAFMRALVAELEKGPMRPAIASEIAARTGYGAGKTTIAAQVETHLGRRLHKWKDDEGRWWGLQQVGP